MARNQGSVRMGPISLFTLVIILCLAVLAVLAVTTANASYVMTERQAAATRATYDGERAGQELLAAVDAALAPMRSEGASAEAVLGAAESALDDFAASTRVRDALPTVTVESGILTADEAVAEAAVMGSVDPADFCGGLQANFMTDSGRGLAVVLGLRDDGTYRILSWKTTAVLDEEGSGDVLWTGAPASQ